MPDRLTIAATTHGRVLVKHPSNPGPWPAIIGFHGYGMNAGHMLADLEQVPGTDDWLLVSVQGLHRFYSRDQQSVVASWMTREDRDLAITDNIRYVGDVVDAVVHAWPFSHLVYAGFSQGVAMAFRAAARVPHACHGIIALGGDVPPELTTDPSVCWPPVVLARGADDAFYLADRFEHDAALLASRNALDSKIAFSGGHGWTDEVRRGAGVFLERVKSR